MNRTLQYTIEESRNGCSVKSFLTYKGYSSQSIIRLKKLPKCILVNNQPAYMNHTLHTGDTLTVHIIENCSSEKIPPIRLPLDIIYEDEDLMVINKPAGMPIHPSMNNYENSLANALAFYFAKQNKPFVFRCINRLDKDTSGLTIIAKHMVSAGMLSAMVADKRNDGITREYLAIVRGIPNPTEGVISAPISRKEGSILERQVDYEQGEKAITHYHTLKTDNGHSLISLQLETGRTHQIRVHMKHIGSPLIGDYLYNPDMEHITRQALHSYELRFVHPITYEPLRFTAPLPPDMAAVL